MTIEDFLQTKSKEEIIFILSENEGGYKISCIECPYFVKDKFGVYKCNSFLYEQCRKEYIQWAEKEMRND